MLKIPLIFLAAALLASCNNGPVNPSPQPPQPPPVLSYPYNPSASVVASSDPRVPYYGDWLWVVGFSDETFLAGKFSVSTKGDAGTGLLNAANGAGSMCSGALASCVNTGVGQGVFGTQVLENGSVVLASAFRMGTNPNQVGFITLDDDMKIIYDAELALPIFEGPGLWFSSSSSSDSERMYVVIAQEDADPQFKSQNLVAASFARLDQTHAHIASQALIPARQVALERMKELLQQL